MCTALSCAIIRHAESGTLGGTGGEGGMASPFSARSIKTHFISWAPGRRQATRQTVQIADSPLRTSNPTEPALRTPTPACHYSVGATGSLLRMVLA